PEPPVSRENEVRGGDNEGRGGTHDRPSKDSRRMGAAETPFDLVTGATGMLGSHIAERLVARGRRVRALVRPGSDTRFLKSLGVDLVAGELNDLPSLENAVRGAEVVYHAAAKVGDWGPWSDFENDTLRGTENLG